MKRLIALFLILFSSVCATDKYKISLHDAIRSGQTDVVLVLLTYYPEQINALSNNESAFELALKYGYEEIAFQLLEHGANPRQNIVRDNLSYTPLYFAISAKSVRCVQKLLEMGADASLIHGPWVMGHAKKTSALHLSAELDDEALFATVLAAQSEHELSETIVQTYKRYEQNEMNWPALHFALYRQDKEAFDLILKHGAPPNYNYFCPHTAFKLALDTNDPYYTQKLIEYRFDATEAVVEAVRALKKDEVLRIISQAGWTPGPKCTGIGTHPVLRAALSTGNYDMIEFVLQLGAQDQYSYSYYFDDLDLLALLLRYNCVHAGATEWAFKNKQFETCRILLNAGLNSLPPMYFPRLIGYGIKWVRLFYEHMDLAYKKEALLEKAIAASALDIVEYLLQQGETSPWALDFCKNLDCLKLVVSYLGITEEQKGRLIQNAIKNNADDMLDYLLSL